MVPFLRNFRYKKPTNKIELLNIVCINHIDKPIQGYTSASTVSLVLSTVSVLSFPVLHVRNVTYGSSHFYLLKTGLNCITWKVILSQF